MKSAFHPKDVKYAVATIVVFPSFVLGTIMPTPILIPAAVISIIFIAIINKKAIDTLSDILCAVVYIALVFISYMNIGYILSVTMVRNLSVSEAAGMNPNFNVALMITFLYAAAAIASIVLRRVWRA